MDILSTTMGFSLSFANKAEILYVSMQLAKLHEDIKNVDSDPPHVYLLHSLNENEGEALVNRIKSNTRPVSQPLNPIG